MTERPGRRDDMAKFRRDLIDSGMSTEAATVKARACAVRKDRREVDRVNPMIGRKQRAADEARERAERRARDR